MAEGVNDEDVYVDSDSSSSCLFDVMQICEPVFDDHWRMGLGVSAHR